MEILTEKVAEQIISIVKSRLNKTFEEYGIKVNILEPKYSEVYMEATITFTLTDAKVNREEERRQFFIDNCEDVGLSKEDFGKTICSPNINGGKEFTIAGLDFHDENPVLITVGSDKDVFYRMSIVDIKKVL